MQQGPGPCSFLCLPYTSVSLFVQCWTPPPAAFLPGRDRNPLKKDFYTQNEKKGLEARDFPPQLHVRHCWHFTNKVAKGPLQQFLLLAEQNLVGRGYTNRTVAANTKGPFCIQTQARSQCAEGKNTTLTGEPRQRPSSFRDPVPFSILPLHFSASICSNLTHRHFLC